MDKQSSVPSKLLEIFEVFSTDKNLNFFKDNKIEIKTTDNRLLFQVNPQEIITPLPLDFLFTYKNPLKDDFVEMSLLEELIQKLSEKQSLVGLNHIGFCYKVDSKNQERERIKSEMIKAGFHLYEEPSNDVSLWLFLGNTDYWQDQMIELLPVEETTDEWIDYWLPHIQIDIDTNLSHTEIEEKVNNIFKGKIKPYRSVVVDHIIYCVRLRLGTVSGVNINLDISTNKRDTKYVREHLPKLI